MSSEKKKKGKKKTQRTPKELTGYLKAVFNLYTEFSDKVACPRGEQ